VSTADVAPKIDHKGERTMNEARSRSETELTPYSLWRHAATGGLYVVLGVGLCGTNGTGEHREKSVIYWSPQHRHWCYREVSEFLDGRFMPTTAPQEGVQGWRALLFAARATQPPSLPDAPGR
jgi:hypothetical protein